jgi:hypothetical protein
MFKFLFPGLVEHRWVCYAWCLDDNSVTVFDPVVLRSSPCDVDIMHKQIVSAFKWVMGELVCKLIPLWDHDWKGATVSLARMSCEFEKW